MKHFARVMRLADRLSRLFGLPEGEAYLLAYDMLEFDR
jgi:hypothetical protein